MLKTVLKEFLLIEGVNTVAIIGLDGFVIDYAQRGATIDIDALGALCASEMRFFASNAGSLKQMILEYEEGAFIFIPITKDEFLAIITDSTAGVGRLNYTLPKISSRIAAVI
jgi:predicted regulator of Ras-like GTPase activity (Roadblock/LC7/MglB family)